jgi:hypothetical protein
VTDDTLGTPAAPLAWHYTSSRKCIETNLKRLAVTKTIHVTPITTGTNFSRCRRNVTIAEHPNGSYTVTYTICESDNHRR